MKFAFFGYDYSLDIAHRLISDGHEPIRFFTFPCDQTFNFNTQMCMTAEQFGIPMQEEKAAARDIEDCAALGCEIFLAAGYPHKIPSVPGYCYGINIHPALLPRARGIMPLPYVLLHEPQAAGFTVHKISDQFDEGDILYQKSVPVTSESDIETLSARIALHLPETMSSIVREIRLLWDDAKPQDHAKASAYPPPDKDMRSLKWDETPENLLRLGRAFGRFGVFATLCNHAGQTQDLAVFNFSAWREPHETAYGTLMRSSAREVVIAVREGFVCLKEFQILS